MGGKTSAVYLQECIRPTNTHIYIYVFSKRIRMLYELTKTCTMERFFFFLQEFLWFFLHF